MGEEGSKGITLEDVKKLLQEEVFPRIENIEEFKAKIENTNEGNYIEGRLAMEARPFRVFNRGSVSTSLSSDIPDINID